MKYNSISIAIFTVATLILSGCANMFIQQHGYIAADAESVRENRKKAYIPGNAPSISQGFKPRPYGSASKLYKGGHEGIDIISKKGTPVIAAASGVVISSFYRPLFGNRILIDHGKDTSGMFIMSRYVHLDKRMVKKGDKVTRGQQIGTLGSTGLLAGGFPHLHFEIRTGNNPVLSKSTPLNPHRFWTGGIGIVTCFDINKQWLDNPIRTTYPVLCR